MGEMGQTFGQPSESAIESHYRFTEEDKFVNLVDDHDHDQFT